MRIFLLSMVLALVGLTSWSVQAFRGQSSAIRTVDGDNDSDYLALAQLRFLTQWEAEHDLAPRPPRTREVVVDAGDSLVRILGGLGLADREAHAAVLSLATVRDIYDPSRDLRIGDRLQARLVYPPGEGTVFDSLLLPVSYDLDIRLQRTESGSFVAEEQVRATERRLVRVAGDIESSLFVDGAAAGIPPPVLIDLIRIFSFGVDFQRGIQPGDRFELMYERIFDHDGQPVSSGAILYANLVLGGAERPLFRFEATDGVADYFNPAGESVRKALMRTPIDGARLSSRFGNRRHPVLGYTRLHAGIDFAAPPGTPVYAAGRGVIEAMGRHGGYGRYIRIRHNKTYKTAYAHLRAYAKGLGRGQAVRQGQIIGYVGSSGLSTGPHLHYEVHRNGKPINPLTLKLPGGEKLQGDRLAAFQEERARIQALYILTPGLHDSVAALPAVDTGSGTAAAGQDREPAPLHTDPGTDG